MNTTLGDTYKLAFAKEAGWIGTGAKTVGKFIAGMPFFIAGMAGTHALLGKKPEVKRMYIPQSEWEQLVNPTQQKAPAKPGRRPARMHWADRQRLGY